MVAVTFWSSGTLDAFNLPFLVHFIDLTTMHRRSLNDGLPPAAACGANKLPTRQLGALVGPPMSKSAVN